jgi:hypothetical protein
MNLIIILGEKLVKITPQEREFLTDLYVIFRTERQQRWAEHEQDTPEQMRNNLNYQFGNPIYEYKDDERFLIILEDYAPDIYQAFAKFQLNRVKQ